MTFFYGPHHVDVPVLADLQEFIFIISTQTQDLVWKTCWEQWMIGMDGERESGRFVLSVWLDEEDDVLSLKINLASHPAHDEGVQ